MEKTIQIYCRNNNKVIEVPIGASLEEAYKESGLQMTHGPINAHVNNKVEGMHFRLYKQKEVEFPRHHVAEWHARLHPFFVLRALQGRPRPVREVQGGH